MFHAHGTHSLQPISAEVRAAPKFCVKHWRFPLSGSPCEGVIANQGKSVALLGDLGVTCKLTIGWLSPTGIIRAPDVVIDAFTCSIMLQQDARGRVVAPRAWVRNAAA